MVGTDKGDQPWILCPKVQIPFDVWQKMMAYVTACAYDEVNGFGLVTVDGDIITVNEVFILEQIASGAGVVTDQKALGRYMYELIRNGGDAGRMKFQWHSHVRMPPFYSATDQDLIERWSGDWLISLVINQYGEYRCRLDVLRPIRLGVEIKPEIVVSLSQGMMRAAREEVTQKVRRRRWDTLIEPADKPTPVFSVGDLVISQQPRGLKRLFGLPWHSDRQATTIEVDAPVAAEVEPPKSFWSRWRKPKSNGSEPETVGSTAETSSDIWSEK